MRAMIVKSKETNGDEEVDYAEWVGDHIED